MAWYKCFFFKTIIITCYIYIMGVCGSGQDYYRKTINKEAYIPGHSEALSIPQIDRIKEQNLKGNIDNKQDKKKNLLKKKQCFQNMLIPCHYLKLI